jgi:hypothetical protein
VAEEGFTSYNVDNDRKFRNAIDQALTQVNDLTIPLTLITKDFFRSQRAIWNLKGPGQYPDLAESTKKSKLMAGIPVYPILKRTGALEKSMVNPSDSNAVAQIVNRKGLILGTRVAYGVYHQSDRPRGPIPLRKFLFIGPEAPRFASSDQMGRLDRWLNILNGYVAEKLTVMGSTSSKGGSV